MTPAESSAPLVPPGPYRGLALASFGIGGLLVLIGLCSGLAFVALPILRAGNALESNTAVASIGAMTVIFGALLLAVGWGLSRDRLTEPFHLPNPALFVALFVGVIIIGQLILTLNVGAAYLFPVWHVLAALMIPLAVLAYAGRRLDIVSWRVMLAQFTWGGFVTIVFALVFEIISGGAIFVLAALFLVVVLSPARFDSLARELMAHSGDMQQLIQILSREPQALWVVGIAAVILFSVFVPLIEETLKSLGPAALMARDIRAPERTRPSRGVALMWGLAAGAGYAFTENMLNAQSSVGGTDALGLWAGTMLLRGGASLMHMATTATVTLGWYGTLVEGKWSRFPLLLFAAVVAHGFWNLVAVGLGGATSLAATRAGGGPDLVTILLVVSALGLLGILLTASMGWIAWLIRWARRAPAGESI